MKLKLDEDLPASLASALGDDVDTSGRKGCLVVCTEARLRVRRT